MMVLGLGFEEPIAPIAIKTGKWRWRRVGKWPTRKNVGMWRLYFVWGICRRIVRKPLVRSTATYCGNTNPIEFQEFYRRSERGQCFVHITCAFARTWIYRLWFYSLSILISIRQSLCTTSLSLSVRCSLEGFGIVQHSPVIQLYGSSGFPPYVPLKFKIKYALLACPHIGIVLAKQIFKSSHFIRQ